MNLLFAYANTLELRATGINAEQTRREFLEYFLEDTKHTIEACKKIANLIGDNIPGAIPGRGEATERHSTPLIEGLESNPSNVNALYDWGPAYMIYFNTRDADNVSVLFRVYRNTSSDWTERASQNFNENINLIKEKARNAHLEVKETFESGLRDILVKIIDDA